MTDANGNGPLRPGNGPLGPGNGPSPSGNGHLGPEDELAAVVALDLALDELAAGDVAVSPIEGEAAVLAAVAAELRAAVRPPPGAAERGRAAFLVRAAEVHGEAATAELSRPAPAAAAPAAAGRRRRLPVRVLALAAALVVLAAVPAVARQARPGTALWPVREAGQELRISLADDPVRRAHLRLDIAEEYLAEGARAGEERREDMADKAGDLIDEVLDQLEGVPGSRAAVERARAERLLLAVRALEHQDDQGGGPGPSGSGPGPGSGSGADRSGSSGGSGGGSPGDDHSGRGGGDDAGDDGGGSGSGSGGGRSGSGSGSGSGSSGSGEQAPGSIRSGSGDG
jgi:polyhydroxyalkanoate synthesis regulator phasin